MGTTSDKLAYLNQTKAEIKNAIIEKGVEVADTDSFRSYANKIAQIKAGSDEPPKMFGVSLNDLFGTLDSNGILTPNSWNGELDFTGVRVLFSKALTGLFYEDTKVTSVNFPTLTHINFSSLEKTFRGCTNITSINLSSVTSVGQSGLGYTFYGCTKIQTVDLSSLTTFTSSNGLNYCFYGCTGLLSVDLSSLTDTNKTGLYYCFNGCTKLTSVDLSSLAVVGEFGLGSAFYGCTNLENINFDSLTTLGKTAFGSAFYNCKKITKFSFPSLTSVLTDSFGSSTSNTAFRGCTALAEIHFRADMQSTIEAMSQYASKWGAPSTCEIYFDL